jgi:energy-coupling factor transport system substrate-specific component
MGTCIGDHRAMNPFPEKPATHALAIIPMGIALNLAIGLAVTALKLPIFLDAIGTVLFTLLCGWRIGATVGVLSFVIGGLLNPLMPYFVFTQFMIALVAGFSAGRGGFKATWRTIITGVAIGYIAALVSAPVIAIVFGGVTNSGESLVTAFLVKTGRTLWQAVVTTKIWTEPLDKVLQCLAAFAIARSLPKTLLARLETPRSHLRANGLL